MKKQNRREFINKLGAGAAALSLPRCVYGAPKPPSARPSSLGPPITDRAAWERAAGWPLFRTAVADAEAVLRQPMTVVTDDDYLEYSRTGGRGRHSRARNARSLRLKTLALAECLENKGRFLPAIEEVIGATCAEKTWMDNAHDGKLDNFEGRATDIDLEVAKTGLAIATAYSLLSEKLSAATRELMTRELERRVFHPYREALAGKSKTAARWLTGTNNWNAICLAGVTGAALATLPSAEDRAVFVDAALKYSRNYLSGFDDDGYSFEGLGYWNYGFEHYLILAELVHRATAGRSDLFAPPKVRRLAAFPARIELTPGVYPAFSDSHVDEAPHPWALNFVSRKFAFGRMAWERPLEPLARMSFYGEFLYEPVMFAFADPKPLSGEAVDDGSGLRSRFPAAKVLLCRQPAGKGPRIAAAFKVGRDAGGHSHHDLGAFVVAVGGTALVLDPGRGGYRAGTFGPKRFENPLLNSFGHPVPLVAGQRQSGGGAAAIIRQEFTDRVDTVAVDLKPLYDTPDLRSLQRTFTFDRAGSGTVRVSDEVAFAQPQAFGAALITLSEWKQVAPNRLVLGSGADRIRVEIAAEGGAVEVRPEEIRESVRGGKLPTRLGIEFKEPLTAGRLTVTITPLPSGPGRE